MQARPILDLPVGVFPESVSLVYGGEIPYHWRTQCSTTGQLMAGNLLSYGETFNVVLLT